MNVFKGERFWLALIAMALVGGLSIAGRITGGEGVSALMALLAGFGVGRGASDNDKEAKTVKSLFPLVLVSMLAVGCSTTNAIQAIDTSVKGVQLASDLAMPFVHAKCMSEAKACAAKNDQVCEPWKACDDSRGKLKLAIDTIQDELVITAKIIEAVCKDGGCK